MALFSTSLWGGMFLSPATPFPSSKIPNSPFLNPFWLTRQVADHLSTSPAPHPPSLHLSPSPPSPSSTFSWVRKEGGRLAGWEVRAGALPPHHPDSSGAGVTEKGGHGDQLGGGNEGTGHASRGDGAGPRASPRVPSCSTRRLARPSPPAARRPPASIPVLGLCASLSPRARGTKARRHPCPGRASRRRSQPPACNARLSAWRPASCPAEPGAGGEGRTPARLAARGAGRGCWGGPAACGEPRRSRRAADPREGTVKALPSIPSPESPS